MPQIIAKAVITSTDYFSQGIARVKIQPDGKVGFIEQKGQIFIPLKFDEVQRFSEGLAGVKVGEQFGYINQNG